MVAELKEVDVKITNYTCCLEIHSIVDRICIVLTYNRGTFFSYKAVLNPTTTSITSITIILIVIGLISEEIDFFVLASLAMKLREYTRNTPIRRNPVSKFWKKFFLTVIF